MALTVHAQDEHLIFSQQEAMDLLKSLNQKNADTVKIDYLLRLALYNFKARGK
jgi:hypothetical protein